MSTQGDQPAPSKATGAEPSSLESFDPPVLRDRQKPRPQIKWNDKPFYKVRPEILKAIQSANSPPILFQRGGRLVRIRQTEAVPRIEELTIDSLRHHVDACAEFLRGKRAGPPPLDFIRDLLAMAEWPQDVFPPLLAITSCPFFRADGVLVTKRGYDAESRLWYEPALGLEYISIPEQPSESEISTARDLIITELLGDFPFADAADRANAIGFLLTPFIHEMTGGVVPMLVTDAPAQGTGKGLLLSTAVIVATGELAAVTPETKSQEEIRKTITSILREGHSWAIFDNLTGTLRSPALASLLTTRHWRDRELGTNTMFSLPNRTIWSATANNLQVDGDLARRAVWCRLDAKMEHPDQRPPESFRHQDILRWAREHRGQLVTSILILIKAWVTKGRPPGQQCMGSFESWARTIGGILETASIPGFLANAQKQRERRDDESSDLRSFVAKWWEKHRDKTCGVNVLFEIVETEEIFPYVAAGEKEGDRRKRLGQLIKKVVGRVVETRHGRFRISDDDRDHSNRKQYTLEVIDSDPTDRSRQPTASVVGTAYAGAAYHAADRPSCCRISPEGERQLRVMLGFVAPDGEAPTTEEELGDDDDDQDDKLKESEAIWIKGHKYIRVEQDEEGVMWAVDEYGRLEYHPDNLSA